MKRAVADPASSGPNSQRITAGGDAPLMPSPIWRQIAIDQLELAERRLELFHALSRIYGWPMFRGFGLNPQRLLAGLTERRDRWLHETARP